MWMIIRNSWKNMYRSPKKSVVIFLIMFLFAFLTCVIVSTKKDISEFLELCNDKYKTIGILEYLGDDYPDEYVVDEKLSDAFSQVDGLSVWEDESVLQKEISQKYFGNIEGYTRTDKYALVRDEAVVAISMPIFVEGASEMYQCFVTDCLYGARDLTGTLLYVDAGDYELDYSKKYVLRIKAYPNSFTMESYYILDYEDPITGQVVSGYCALEKGDSIPKVYEDMAHKLRVKHNGITITPTKDLECVPLFHQNELLIAGGRSFTEAEYNEGSKVCVISHTTAGAMGKGIGDFVTLYWNDLGEVDFWDNYDIEKGFAYKETFEIVGITNEMISLCHNVFVPDGALFGNIQKTVGYEIGYVQVENEKAFDYALKVLEVLPKDFRFTIYDQGYNQVAGTYLMIEKIMNVIILGGLLLCVAFLGLVGYIMVIRQQNTALIMQKLGSGKGNVFVHFLSQGVIFGMTASVLGASLAKSLHNVIWQEIEKLTNAKLAMDLRFSDFNLSVKGFDAVFEPSTGLLVYVLTALVYLLLVCAIVALFVVAVVKEKKSKTAWGKKSKEKAQASPTKSRRLRKNYSVGPRKPYGSFGFAISNLYRDKVKTIVVALIALVSICFGLKMIEMWNTSQANYDKLLYEQTLRGYYTDYSGRPISTTELLLDPAQIEKVEELDFIEKVGYSTSEMAIFLGVVETADGEEFIYERKIGPDKMVAWYRLEQEFLNGDRLVFTNDMQATSEFGGKAAPEITFLEGYSEAYLKEESKEEGSTRKPGEAPLVYGIISEQFMIDKGIGLGDTVVFAISEMERNLPGLFRAEYFLEYKIKVIGSFVGKSHRNYIYCPYASYEGNNKITSASFTFKGLNHIRDKKDAMLEAGMGQAKVAGRNRSFVVLEDGVAQNNLSSMRQQDFYTKLVIILMSVVCIFGNAMTGYFLVNHRSKEIAIMRSLGAGKVQIYKAFTLDQVLIYFAGSGLGLAVAKLMGIGMKSAGEGTIAIGLGVLLLALAFVAYFIGVMVAAASAVHGNVKVLMSGE